MALPKVELKSGETEHVILALDKRSFSIHDTAALRWMSSEGTYEVMVGTSSATCRCLAQLRLTQPAAHSDVRMVAMMDF